MSIHPPNRVAVVGGGISGLAAAHRLLELRPNLNITLFESNHRLGGVLRTERVNEVLIEHSADMFITKEPWGMGLCQRLGMSDELISTNEQFRRSFVAFRGKLHPIPEGFTLMVPTSAWSILKSGLLSWSGKARMGYEYFLAGRPPEGDESLASFVTRRLGKESFERLVQPLIGGIYTADPEKLSMAATMPMFRELEKEHGGLIRGMRQRHKTVKKDEASGARYGAFVAPRNGMQQLVDALTERLSNISILYDARIESIVNREQQWEVRGNHGMEAFDAVILATPAEVSASLIRSFDADLATELSSIPHASAAIVVDVFERSAIAHPLNGFGLVVPHIENRPILACSFSSVKFSGRAPNEQVVLRTFVGGALQQDLLQQSDQELSNMTHQQLRQLLGVKDKPQSTQVVRWERRMPQYHVDHLERIERIEQQVASHHGLELCGNAYRGVGIPRCIQSGESASERVCEFLNQTGDANQA